MQDFITFTIIGLSLGAAYAVAASGLVVTYTTTGIFNFAHGAVAMFSAFLYWELRFSDGALGGWPAPIALIAVLLIFAPLLGLLIERVLMRGLEGLSETTKLVIPIALLLLLRGLATWEQLWGSAESRVATRFFGDTSKVEIGGVNITTHDIIIFGVAIALALGLRLLLYNTRTGVTMRAVVDDRPLTELNGARPVRTAQFSWILGIVLASLAGVLVGTGSLTVDALTLLVINAYAAALFGRLRSLPMTYLGAMILGLVVTYWQSYVPKIQNTFDVDLNWLSQLRNTWPVIVLFIVLIFLPQDRLRGAVVSRTRERFTIPTLKNALIWSAVLIVVMVGLQAIMNGNAASRMSTGIGFGIIALSLVLLTGYAGEVNLAPLAFAGIGSLVVYQFDIGTSINSANSDTGAGLAILAVSLAAAAAVIVLPAFGVTGLRLAGSTLGFAGAVFLVIWFFDASGTAPDRAFRVPQSESMSVAGLVLGTLVAAVVGALVALPALRLRGLYLGLATFAFSVFVTNMIFRQQASLQFNMPFVGDGEDLEINIAPPGQYQMPRPHWLGVDLAGVENDGRYLVFLTFCFCVIGLGLVLLRGSSYGRRLAAMKDSPAACATLGLDLVRMKLSVFTLSAAIAGFGGALYAGNLAGVNEDTWLIFVSLPLFMMAVVGGIGYVSGALIAGILLGPMFAVIEGIGEGLAEHFPSFAWLFDDGLAKLIPKVGTAFIAIGLARNPSGIANDFIEGYRPLFKRAVPVAAGAVALQVVLWLLAFTDVIGNWVFGVLSALLWLVVPAVGAAVMPRAFADDDREPEDETPLSLIGLDRPFNLDDRGLLDRKLGIVEDITPVYVREQAKV